MQRAERFLRDMSDMLDLVRADSGREPVRRGGGGGRSEWQEWGSVTTYDGAFDQQLRSDSIAFTERTCGPILRHYDAGFSAMFARSLEYIYQQPFDIEYPALRARQLIPVDTQPPAGADYYTYRMFDKTGRAEIVHNYAGQSFPEADVLADEWKQLIVSLGAKYSYTVQDMRAAAMAGVPLEAKKAEAARFAIEKRIEEIAWAGDTATGLVGITNAPGVQSVTKVSPAGTWAAQITAAIAAGTVTATAQAILADVNAMANAIYSNTQGNHKPTTLVLPIPAYAAIMTQTRAPGFTSDTIGQFILEASPWLNEIVDWAYLNGASAGQGEALMYEKDPRVLGLVISQDFEQFPPEIEALRWLVYCHLRTGGVCIRYPLAVATMTGIS